MGGGETPTFFENVFALVECMILGIHRQLTSFSGVEARGGPDRFLDHAVSKAHTATCRLRILVLE